MVWGTVLTFLSVCFGIGCETLCRGCFEFLGCGVGYGVDFCLYASVLDAERCAEGLQWNCNEVLDVRCTSLRNSAVHVAYSREPQSMRHMRPGSTTHAAYTAKVPQPMRHIQPRFRNLCGIYSRVSTIYIMQQYILQKYTKFRLIYFGSVSIADTEAYRHKLVSFSIPQSLHYIKRPRGVCRGARPCAPLGFLTFQCGSPAAGGRSLCIYGRDSQSMRPFGRGLRSPCGYYFPIQNLENISLTRSSQVILPESVPDFRMHLSGLWNKNPPAFRFLCYFSTRERLSRAFKSSCLWRSLVM